MALADDKHRFCQQVLPSHPNEWQVDETFARLANMDDAARAALLDHVPAIWPVSHSLCFAYLEEGANALALFPPHLLGAWVRQLLGLYEKKGLAGAREFMGGIDKYFLGPMRGEAGVHFADISPRLIPYLRGVSGLPLQCAVASLPSTDTRTIYLPGYLDVFPERDNNVLLYKVLATLQWGQIASRIYPTALMDHDASFDPLTAYPDRHLAHDLLAVLQFIKVYRFVQGELPGLVRRSADLVCHLVGTLGPLNQAGDRFAGLRALLLLAIGRLTPAETSHLRSFIDNPWSVSCLATLPALYSYMANLSGDYQLGQLRLLLGEFDFPRAGEEITRRREQDKVKFVAQLAGVLAAERHDPADNSERPRSMAEKTSGAFLLLQRKTGESSGNAEDRQMRLVEASQELPSELLLLANTIIADLGSIPEAYTQAAAGLAGGGVFSQDSTDTTGTGEGPVLCSVDPGYTYDEWDYRRAGYRQKWCTLQEKVLDPVGSSFVMATLEKYRPQLKRLRRQFALLRPSHRMVRRRRHGDDIDLDALIEAFCDSRAGLAPTDRVFQRQQRIHRDMSAIFLVDMSSSTEGWIGLALKESLVLLAEAVEEVGDSYAIYGFSGMRRSRSELFQIKHAEEPYGPTVQARIAAITPKEYTRMGPPIRHLTRKLLAAPGKVRLLLVISDGKPEDYDDYKGRYAIEDTRKALLEARGSGVYPFCITIDKSAHEYLPHMFGRGNYIFINDVSLLPARMTEMYRLLTG